LKENEKELRLKLHELEDREINISAKEKSLKKILQQLEKQELLLKKKEEELAGSDIRFVKRMEVLKQHEIETDKLLRQKQKEILDREKELKRLEKDLEKRERVVDIEDRALNYAETEVETQRKKLEDDEFRQYLHEKLGLMKESGININDIQQSQVIKVPDLQEHRETIQDLIAKCRHMVKLGRTREAKLFYNKIRQLFYSLTFPTKSEKENLFNTVRLIYDEINLAEMEGNNN
ncbi:MAG: hypothetical protein KKF44_08400, partial [Nanoarchaeota archaeon]|nr:hypothetical protein [Nanoarchaeota archaeon]